MVHPRRSRYLVAGAGALLTTGLLLGAMASPASAAGTVTKAKGSAYGYRAYNIKLLGGSHPATGPTPNVALTSNASNSPQSATATTGLVQYGPATLFTSDGISLMAKGAVGTAGSVTSSSSVMHINKATTQPSTGSEPLTADSIASSCSASISGTSGSTTISMGATLETDNGTTPVFVTLPTNPTRNLTISGVVHVGSTIDHFHYVFNQQIVNSAGQLTVNAVHEYFDGPSLKGNLIIGQVICGVR